MSEPERIERKYYPMPSDKKCNFGSLQEHKNSRVAQLVTNRMPPTFDEYDKQRCAPQKMHDHTIVEDNL